MKHWSLRLCAAPISLCLTAGSAATQSAQPPPSVNCERDDRHPDEVWEQTEAHCLGLLESIAVRTEGTLHLKLENGATTIFTDVTDGCAPENFTFERCFGYRLQEYSRTTNTFAVRVSYSECGYFIVIDRRSGEQLELDTMPAYSPRGTRLVSVNASELCGRPYDIAIWSGTAPFAPEWQYSTPKDDLYETWEFIGWDGEDRIKLRAGVYGGKGGGESYDTEAIRTVQGWDLKRPWVTR